MLHKMVSAVVSCAVVGLRLLYATLFSAFGCSKVVRFAVVGLWLLYATLFSAFGCSKVLRCAVVCYAVFRLRLF